MSRISIKSAAKYALLPEVMPRAKSLFASGFGMIAFLMAHVYATVRLLPANHPYLSTKNIGKFGMRHTIAEAANHLVVKKENWDQILVFITILTGIVLLFGQVVLFLVALLFEPVWAQSLFATPPPGGGSGTSIDVAFLLLDRVFGVPNFFCAIGDVCTDVLAGGRWPFHVALHSMFKFYSMGLLVVAVLIFLYFVVVVVAETATTGSPFGERFQNIWVPIRLVVALFLLTPINYGLNSGQYIALYAAKAGSGMATNGWHRFNNVLRSNAGARANPLGETNSLLALPVEASIEPLVQFMSLAHGCAYAEWKMDNQIHPKDETLALNLDAESTVPPDEGGGLAGSGFYVKPYFVKTALSYSGDLQPKKLMTASTSYAEALDFYDNSDIIIRFGRDVSGIDGKEGVYTADIQPICGEVRVHVTSLGYKNSGNMLSDIGFYGGAPMVQQAYFNLVKQLWYNGGGLGGSDRLLQHFSQRMVEVNIGGVNVVDPPPIRCRIGCSESLLPSCSASTSSSQAPCAKEEGTNFSNSIRKTLVTTYQATINSTIRSAWDLFNQNGMSIAMTQEIYDRGWGGAGIWYNTISDINGAFVTSVFATPAVSLFPEIMEKVRDVKRKHDNTLSGLDQFNPTTSGNFNIEDEISTITGNAMDKAKAMYKLFEYWHADMADPLNDNKAITGNPFIDVINFIFGTEGIFAMRGENAKMHPLAQLSAVGKGIIESAIRNLAIATGLSVMGGPLDALGLPVGQLADLASSLFSTTAFIGLTAGVVLYYVLPLMPFVFFFFAVGGWVKGLFEAMVGLPLWALAHLRIDGEGLPGEAAANGYYLILEIFIRPILTVFGLIASTVIFTAQVRILHFIWDLVVSNVSGYEGDSALSSLGLGAWSTELSASVIDQFFFTIIYVIIVYMMATASFKLIDMIPDNIMRWMGSGISSFGDTDKNPTEGLTRMAATGGMIQGNKLISGFQSSASGAGKSLGDALRSSPQAPAAPPANGGN